MHGSLLKWWIACCILWTESIYRVHTFVLKCTTYIYSVLVNKFYIYQFFLYLVHIHCSLPMSIGKVQCSLAAAWGLWCLFQLHFTGLLYLCHWRAVFGPSYHIINNADTFSFGPPGEINYSNGHNSTVAPISPA